MGIRWSGDVVELTHDTFITLMESKDRDIRKGGLMKRCMGLMSSSTYLCTNTQGVVKVHNCKPKVRHYNSARHAALAACLFQKVFMTHSWNQ